MGASNTIVPRETKPQGVGGRRARTAVAQAANLIRFLGDSQIDSQTHGWLRIVVDDGGWGVRLQQGRCHAHGLSWMPADELLMV
jgi:hypothetical protein